MKTSMWRLLICALFAACMSGAAGCDDQPGGSTDQDMAKAPDLAPHVCVVDVDTFDNGCLLAP